MGLLGSISGRRHRNPRSAPAAPGPGGVPARGCPLWVLPRALALRDWPWCLGVARLLFASPAGRSPRPAARRVATGLRGGPPATGPGALARDGGAGAQCRWSGLRTVGQPAERAGLYRGLSVALGLLFLAALGLTRGVRRFTPPSLPYVWRQGLANLHRPANQTRTVVLALGFGTFLQGTLLVVQQNLLRELNSGEPRRPAEPRLHGRPEGSARRDRDDGGGEGGTVRSTIPIVPMRVLTVKGRPVAELLAAPGTTEEVRSRWALRRQFMTTYRDRAHSFRTRGEGRFWEPGRANRSGSGRSGFDHHHSGSGAGCQGRGRDRVGRAGCAASLPRHQRAGGRMGALRAQLPGALPGGSARSSTSDVRHPRSDGRRERARADPP